MENIEEIFGKSNRRRCVKGRSSYFEPPDDLPSPEDKPVDNNFNNSEDYGEYDKADNVEVDDADEEAVTIDLSDFFKFETFKPLLPETSTENAADSGGLFDCHSQFRVTSSVTEPSQIVVKDLEEEIHAEASFKEPTAVISENGISVPVENSSSEISSENASWKENINGAQHSPNKLQKAPQKNLKTLSKQKAFNKNNVKLFGKYPLVQCEKLDIDNFVKRSKIKVGNWPLINRKSKPHTIRSIANKKSNPLVIKQNLKPFSRPISFNKFSRSNGTVDRVASIISPVRPMKPAQSVFLNGAIQQISIPKKIGNKTPRNNKADKSFNKIAEKIVKSPVSATSVVVDAVQSVFDKLSTKKTKPKQVANKINLPPPVTGFSSLGCKHYNSILNDMIFGFDAFDAESFDLNPNVENENKEETSEGVPEVSSNEPKSTETVEIDACQAKQLIENANEIASTNSMMNFQTKFSEISTLPGVNLVLTEKSVLQISGDSERKEISIEEETNSADVVDTSLSNEISSSESKPQNRSSVEGLTSSSENYMDEITSGLHNDNETSNIIRAFTATESIDSNGETCPKDTDLEAEFSFKQPRALLLKSDMSQSLVKKQSVPLNEVIDGCHGPSTKCALSKNTGTKSSITKKKWPFIFEKDDDIETLSEAPEPLKKLPVKKAQKRPQKNTQYLSSVSKKQALTFGEALENADAINKNTFVVTAEVHKPPDGYIPEKTQGLINILNMQPTVVLTDIYKCSSLNQMTSTYQAQSIQEPLDTEDESNDHDEIIVSDKALQPSTPAPMAAALTQSAPAKMRSKKFSSEAVTLPFQMALQPSTPAPMAAALTQSAPAKMRSKKFSSEAVTLPFQMALQPSTPAPMAAALTQSAPAKMRSKKFSSEAVTLPFQMALQPSTPAPMAAALTQSAPAKMRSKKFSSEAVTLPFQMGWRRELVHRANYDAKSGKKQSDIYYFTPEGIKLRSMVDISKYLSKQPGSKLTFQNFTFEKELIYRAPGEKERSAKKKKNELPVVVTKAASLPSKRQIKIKIPYDV